MKRLVISAELIMQVLSTGYVIDGVTVEQGVDPAWKLVEAHIANDSGPNKPDLVLLFEDGSGDIVTDVSVQVRRDWRGDR
jgi:hypothetical protein